MRAPRLAAPFRVGATSFLVPGGWLANVDRVAGRVDDVEILLFEADGDMPDEAELAGLAAWKERAGLSYTIHTPLDVSLASPSEDRRQRAIDAVCRAVERTRSLAPHAVVVHVYLGEREGDDPPVDRSAWRRRAAGSLEAILARGVAAADLCVETLDYDFAEIEPVIADLGLSVALDLGHLARDGRDERALVDRNLARTRVIQWHGVEPGGRDHRSLVHYPADKARWVVDALVAARYRGVVTLEVFRADDFEESLALLGALLAGAREEAR